VIVVDQPTYATLPTDVLLQVDAGPTQATITWSTVSR